MKKGLISALLIVSGTIVYFFQTEAVLSYQTGYEIGRCLRFSLIVAVLSYAIWRVFKKKKGLGLLCFSVLFFITSTVNFSLKNKNWKFGIDEKNNITGNEEGLVQQFAKNEGSSNEIALTCDVFKKLVEIKKADPVELVTDATDWENLQCPETWCNKDKILAAQNKFQELQSTFVDSELKIKNAYNEIVEFINSYNANEEFKAGFLKGFEARWKQNEGLLLELIKIKKEEIALNQAVLEFFFSIEGKVECVNKELVFERDEDIDKLNSFIPEFEALAKREDCINKKMQETVPAWQQVFTSEKSS